MSASSTFGPDRYKDGSLVEHAPSAAPPITPPDGYGNSAREGASAPDAAPDASRTALTNLRCPVCGASVEMFKDQVQFDKRTGKQFLITPCCKASIRYDEERLIPRRDSSPSPKRAADICATAAQLVGGDRETTHGDKTANFANTAALWNALLECKLRHTPSVAPSAFQRLDALDVANMLELFKIARRYSGSHNLDDYIDGAGYAGCAGEIAEKFNGPKPTT